MKHAQLTRHDGGAVLVGLKIIRGKYKNIYWKDELNNNEIFTDEKEKYKNVYLGDEIVELKNN